MSILKVFAVVFGLNIFEFLIAPISNAIVTKNLSVEHYGVMGYWGAVLAIVSAISSLGFGSYNFKMIPGRKLDDQYYYLGRTLLIEVIFVIICSTLVAVFFKTELLHYSLFLIFILRSILIIVNNELIRFLGYQKRNILKSVIALLDARLWIIPLLLVIISNKQLTVSKLFSLQLISSCTVLFIFFFFVSFKKLFNNLRFDKKILREGLQIGLPLIMVDLGQSLLDMSNRYFLKLFLDYKNIGLYNYVFIWTNIILKFSMLIVYVSQPYFAEAYNMKNFNKFKSTVQVAAKYMILISLITGIGYVTNYESIVLLLGKEEYLITKSATLIMIFYPPILGLSIIFQIIGILTGDTKKLPLVYFFSIIVFSVCNIFLIPKFGYIGAAISSVIGYTSLLIAMLICYKDKAEVSKSIIIDLRMYIIPLIFLLMNILLQQINIHFFIVLLINIILVFVFIIIRIIPNRSDILILKNMNN